MYIRGFDLASDTQTGCYIRGFDLQHTSSGGFMHEVLISLLAWRRELIHEVCISHRRAESPKRDQNLVNNAAFHKQNRLIGGLEESKPRE